MFKKSFVRLALAVVLLPAVSSAVAAAPPSLAEFMARVWEGNPAVQGAEAALEAARARLEGADRPLHNPALELEAERGEADLAAVGLSQTIDWSDKRGARSAVARHELELARAALAQRRQQIASEVLDALARYATAREMVALAERRADLMADFVATAERRHRAGDVGPLDVTLARVAHSEALMRRAARHSELAEAEADLRAVSGFGAARWPELPEALLAQPAALEEGALEALPELRALRAGAAAARARVEEARREGRVDPTIGVRAGREGEESLFGLRLELPLFVRNDFSEIATAAEADARAASLAYRDALRRARARLDAALARFENTRRAWREWSAAGREALERQADLLERMWRAGELAATDYLIQARQNIDTQASAAELEGELRRAAVAWLAASGRIETFLAPAPGAAQ